MIKRHLYTQNILFMYSPGERERGRQKESEGERELERGGARYMART